MTETTNTAYSNLPLNGTAQSENFDVTEEETVTFKVVQWTSGGSEYTKAGYRLVDVNTGNATSWHYLSGDYTSEDGYVSITDVLPGTYYGQVINAGSEPMSGNYFVEY